MRILRVCPSTLGGHLRKFRKSFVAPEATFNAQIEVYKTYNILLPGSWATEMGKLGHEVFETIYNDISIQLVWASENLATSNYVGSRDPFWNIFVEQVLAFKPDLIYIYAGANLFFEPPQREYIIEELGIPIANLWGDELPSNLNYESMFGRSLINHTSSDEYCKTMTNFGVSSIRLGNCFDPLMLNFINPGEKKHNFTFCGVSGFGFADHVGRYERLKRIMKNTDLKIWTSEPKLSRKNKLKKALLDTSSLLPSYVNSKLQQTGFVPGRLNRYLQYGEVQRISSRSQLKHFVEASNKPFCHDKSLGEIYRWSRRVKRALVNPHHYFQLLSDSSVVLNLHRDELADIANIRVYEAAGVGSLLATDKKSHLAHIFDVENDILAFDELPELFEKYDYLKSRPELVIDMAKRAQKKVLGGHTTAHRCEQIDQDIKEAFRGNKSKKKIKPASLLATYDLNKRPLSYDFAFFIQSALIEQRRFGLNDTVVQLILPDDLDNIAGFSDEANQAVDKHSKKFRIKNVLIPLIESFGLDQYRLVTSKTRSSAKDYARTYPNETEHHNEYYRAINSCKVKCDDLRSSVFAKNLISDLIPSEKPLVTITFRLYDFDKERNSRLQEWRRFVEAIEDDYDVVLIPDTDNPSLNSYLLESEGSGNDVFERCRFFPLAAFNFDIRLALYEKAKLNMFVNNGPCVAATLSKKVKFLMFKMIVPSVPHCTEAFLADAGYTVGQNPSYLGPSQKYTWLDDDFDSLISSFNEFESGN